MLVICAGLVVAAAVQAQALNVQWDWKLADKCSKSSPQLKVTGMPDGTKLLRVKLVDSDVPTYHHGGGEVANDGSGVIPERALGTVGSATKNFSAKSAPQ